VQWIAAGGFHTCALLDKNELKCWGFNFYGQLGLGDTFDRGNLQGQMGDSLHVVDLGAMRSAVSIGASEHTCAVLDDKSLKCWGDNNIGQLGQGDHLDRGDDPGEMGDNLAPISLGDGRSAVSVAAAYDHTCAILDGGDVKCWGANSGIFPGELGLGDNVTRGNLPNQMGNRLPVLYFGLGHNATAIAAGQYHTCVILEDSQVKCWGRNESGELGYGDKEDRGAKPTDMGDNLPEIDLGKDRRAVSICAGSQHTCALLDHAQVKCWGKNDQGQLGQGDTSNRGDDAGEMGDNLPVIDLAAPVTSIACGVDFNCALLEGGRVKCWGHNRNGTLGLGDTTNRGDAMGQMGVNLPYVLLGN
jgi:alpha-tubulin suppressor-like RCC1 family protein